jgi:uroporphyrinogen-III synthase
MKDKTVAILESRLGTQFAELIEKHGGRALHAPALAEVADLDRNAIARLVADLESRPPRVAVFQTGVGTRALFETTDALGLTARLLAVLAHAVVAARGPKPTGALRGRGVRIDAAAREPYTTHEVLAALAQTPVAGERVVVQRYGVTNAELEEALEARGAEVIEIPTYRWSLPGDTRPMITLMDALDRGGVDAVAVTNAAQVHNLFELAETLGRKERLQASLNRTLIASIGPVSSAALRKFGVTVGLESSPPKLGPLMAALDDALKISGSR